MYADGKITRTLTLNNLGNISAKQSSYSNTIKLPKTSNNLSILNLIGVAGNTSISGYTHLPCDYYYDTLPVFNGGYAIINRVTNKNIEISIFNGIVEFSVTTKSKLLTDLDFSQLEHNLNFFDLYDNDFDASDYANYPNYFYPSNVDYVADNANKVEQFGNNVILNEIYPTVSTKWLMKQIFEQNGYQLEGDLFEEGTSLFEQISLEYITLSEGYVYDTPIVRNDDFIINDSPYIINQSKNSSFIVNHELDNFENVNNREYMSINFNRIITIKYNGYLNLRFRPDYSLVNGGARLVYRNSRTPQISYDIYTFKKNDTPPEFVVNEFVVEDGDVITLELILTSENTNPNNNQANSHRINGEFNLYFQFGNRLVGNYLVTADKFKFGQIKQLDFVKDILNRYGLLLNKKPNSNIFQLKSIGNLVDRSKTPVVDYSDKLIEIFSEEYGNSYAQENILKYKYPDKNEYYNGRFFLNNRLAVDEKTLFTSPFEVFPSDENFNINYVAPLVTIGVEKDINIEDREDEDYEIAEGSVKVLRLVNNPNKITTNYWNGQLPITTKGSFEAILPLNFYTTINRFYGDFIKLLEQYKVINVKLNFNLIDQHDFDFYTLIYLKQTGKYYYVNKIKYNVASPIADAELVELPF